MENLIRYIYCEGRKRKEKIFSSNEEANNFIAFMNAVSGTDKSADIKAVYCPVCAGWHLLHGQETDETIMDGDHKNVLFNLEALINELKQSFEASLWYIWQPRIEQAKEWIEQLEEDESFSLFLVEAKRQMVHFSTIVQNKEKKVKTKTTKIRNALTRAENIVIQSITKLKVQDCLPQAKVLDDLISQSWFAALTEEEQERYVSLSDSLNDEGTIHILYRSSALAKSARLGIDFTPTDQLKTMYVNMKKRLEELEEKNTSPLLLTPFQRELERVEKQLTLRGDNYIDEKTGLDRVVVALQKHVDFCNRKCDEAESYIEMDDTIEALTLLQAADDHIRNIPLGKEKTRMLQRIVDLTNKCI